MEHNTFIKTVNQISKIVTIIIINRAQLFEGWEKLLPLSYYVSSTFTPVITHHSLLYLKSYSF